MLLAPLESVLNRNIAASSAARTACRRLEGKTLAVHLQSSTQAKLLSLYFSCAGDRLSIASQGENATATLSGTPLAFAGMLGAGPESAMRQGSVRIEGDAEVAQAFRDLLRAARPDVEEELSRLIGDVAAHRLGAMARAVTEFGRRAVTTFGQNVSEFLQEESRDVVTRTEIDEFVESVDHVREGLDRAEARLLLLERKAKK